MARHKCLKYTCTRCDKYIVTAKKPKQPIEKSIASSSLLAYIAVQKYADAMPLYRQPQPLKNLMPSLYFSDIKNISD